MKWDKESLIKDLESIKTEGVISGRENQEIDRLNMRIDWIIELVKEGEYDEPNCYSFIKSDYNTIMTYCLKCAQNYKIDKKPFMKENGND